MNRESKLGPHSYSTMAERLKERKDYLINILKEMESLTHSDVPKILQRCNGAQILGHKVRVFITHLGGPGVYLGYN